MNENARNLDHSNIKQKSSLDAKLDKISVTVYILSKITMLYVNKNR